MRRTALLALASLALAGVSPWLGSTAASADATTQSTKSVTVFLKPTSERALTKLAHQQIGSRSQRQHALATVLPSQAEHDQAVAALDAAGFTVTDQSTWSITATAPATTVAATFGTRPTLPSNPTLQQRRAATGALPDLPSSLDSVAIAAFPTTGGPRAFRRLSTSYGGSDFRNAYTSAARTKSGLAPLTGSARSPQLTIATIQLSGWNSSDLATYAKWKKLSYSSSMLTQVPVDQASVPKASSDDDGDIEVDLDQESLLSTAPHAHQRAYFAPNTDAGFADAFSQVLDDVEANGSAVGGGDTHIAALSVSWGACEALTDSDQSDEISDVLEPIMQSLVAAGVTIFASSGDSGIYDCTSDGTHYSQGVDYPAASPEVVGVGGTKLATTNHGPNSGSNWSESAWSCTSLSACATSKNATGGSGGGASSLFSEPAYQSSTLSSSLNASGKRLVPDIAADADEDTGFGVYTTDAVNDCGGGCTGVVGGTSLASPVSAGLFTNMLEAHGVAAGIGDIHTDLYDAATHAGTFRDVTSGANGPSAGNRAARGYDTVTGLGSALWPAIGDLVFGAGSSRATATISMVAPRSSSRAVKVTWAGHADSGVTLSAADVTVMPVGGTTAAATRLSTSPSGSLTFTAAPGTTYQVAVDELDSGHRFGPVTHATVRVPLTLSSFHLKGGWRKQASTAALGGRFVTSTKKKSVLTATATGSTYQLVVRVGPKLGKMAIAFNGTHVKTVNLHAKKAGFRTISVRGASTAVRSRTIRLTPVKRAKIGIDAIYAVR